jgi:hypothetical protein
VIVTRDLIQMLGAPEHWVRNRIRSGVLKPVRLGCIFVWPEPEVEKARRLLAEDERQR